MRRKSVSTFVKKMTAGALAVAMVVAGFVIIPKTAEAAYTYGDAVKYKKYENTVFKDLYNDKAAPIEDGYVFGGWYSEKETDVYTPLTESEAGVTEGEVYAKFVPAYVLSVKAQNKYGTGADTEKTNARILSSVDSKDYLKVGFDLYLANRIPMNHEITKVYGNIKVGENGVPYTPENVFGTASKYFSIWRLEEIEKSNYGKIMYVRPYWVTMDGTKVYGLAKYVHIEDGYLSLISVPINLMSDEKLAAGVVEMNYDNGAGLKFHDFEEGRVFEEMAFNPDTAGKVKMVGNKDSVGNYASGECLYGNIRFEMSDTLKSNLYDSNNERSNWFYFTFTGKDFSNWDEDTQNVRVWDLQY